MAIKVNQGGKWTPVYGATDFQTNTPLGLDATLTKSRYAADAKSVGSKLGDLTNLNTIDKKNLVNAINEVAINAGAGAALFTINIDTDQKVANYTRDEIANMAQQNRLIMAITNLGKVASFLFVGIHDTLEEVAVFAHTEVQSNNTVVTTFYRIYNDKRVVIREMPHTNPIDMITAEEGQLARVKAVNFEGHPIEWEAFNMDRADNGILVIYVSGNGSTHTLEEIQAAVTLGQYVFALYSNKYVPLYSINSEYAVFHLTSIQEESKGLTLKVDVNGTVSVSQTDIQNLNYIPSPQQALVGQTIAVSSIDAVTGAPLTWAAVNFPESTNYEIPSFDLITNNTPEIAVIDDTSTTLSIKPNDPPSIIEIDTENIMLALARGPINLKFQYTIDDTTSYITSAILNPIYFQERNMFMAGLVDYINNMPCFVFFTFELNKITGQAKTLNEELALDTSLKESGQAAEAKAVGEALSGLKNDIRDLIPSYDQTNSKQYLVVNDDGTATQWHSLPHIPNPEESENGYVLSVDGQMMTKWIKPVSINIDRNLKNANEAADAAAVGSAINKVQSSINTLNNALTTKIQIVTWGEAD